MITAPEHQLPLPPWAALVSHITDFLRWQFSMHPPGAYRFSATDGAVDERSELWIGSEFPIKPDTPGQRPAISVFRSAAQFNGLSIGDLGFVDIAGDKRMLTDLVPLNLMVGVLCRHQLEAEILAGAVVELIFGYRREIIANMGNLLYIGNRPSISPPSPPGQLVEGSAFPDWTAVMIGFPAFVNFKLTIEPLNKRFLSSIGVAMTTAVPTAPSQGVVPLQGSAIMQPPPTPPSTDHSGGGLPQTPSSEAESTSEPLTVTIEAS